MKQLNPLVATLGAALLSATAFTAQAAQNPFAVQELSSGYNLAAADKAAEGSCGEGKCGGEVKADSEGKCGGEAAGKTASAEGKCGEGKCGAEKAE